MEIESESMYIGLLWDYTQRNNAMAIVYGPAMSLRASGNVGPICYARWRGMQVARDRWTGTQPCVGAQAVVQEFMREVTRAWGGSMTAEQRNMWEEFARNQRWVNKLGQEWQPTGYLAFVSMSMYSMNLVGYYSPEPPVRDFAALPGTVYVGQPGAEWFIRVMMDEWAGGVEPDVIQIFRAGPYTSGGYHAQSNEFRVVQVVGPPFSWDDWTIVTEHYYWYRVRWGFNVGIVGPMCEEQAYCIEYPPP